VEGGHAGGRGGRAAHQEPIFGGRRARRRAKRRSLAVGGRAQGCGLLRSGRAGAAVQFRSGGRAGAVQRRSGKPESEGRRRTVGRREEMVGGKCRWRCTRDGRRARAALGKARRVLLAWWRTGTGRRGGERRRRQGTAAASAASGAQGQGVEGEAHGEEVEENPSGGTETEAKDRWIAESWRPRCRSRGKRERAKRRDMGGGGPEGVAVAEDWISARAGATRGLTCSRRW
jgi:hypothetical protein